MTGATLALVGLGAAAVATGGAAAAAAVVVGGGVGIANVAKWAEWLSDWDVTITINDQKSGQYFRDNTPLGDWSNEGTPMHYIVETTVGVAAKEAERSKTA
jgi:uncharacterized protein (DUF58 family)